MLAHHLHQCVYTVDDERDHLHTEQLWVNTFSNLINTNLLTAFIFAAEKVGERVFLAVLHSSP